MSAVSAANYQLVAAGADGKFGTADDVQIALTPIYSAANDTVTLALPGGALPDGAYRLTVSATGQLIDASGNSLNGAGASDNSASPFVRTFSVDRSHVQPPVVSNLTLSTPSNATLAVSLAAADPQNLPLTYAIVTGPKHGAIQNFDAAAGTFAYVPDVGYTGQDTIVFAATDSKLASSQGSVAIAVSAYRTAPVASDESAAAVATRPTAIVLQGYDAQIPVSALTLVIVTAPAHGVAAITGQDTITYTAAAGYSGADSFRYAWIDATVTPSLQSAPATVSLSVTSVNQPPVTAAATVSAVENKPYVFGLADFPYSDPNNAPATALSAVVVASLPSAAAGALADNGVAVSAGAKISAADIAAGKFVFTPAAGVFGAGAASFAFEVENSGGGHDTSTPSVLSVNLAYVNKAPTTSAVTLSVNAGSSLTLTSGLFPFVDANTPSQAFAGVIITALPTAGSLTFNGAAVAANQFVSKAQLDAGDLVFTPAPHVSGAAYASFGFAVVDAGSTANGGQTASAAATATINVAGVVNQAPTTGPTTITVYENRAHAFALAEFPFSDATDPNPTALKAVIVVSLPASGQLSLNGVAIAAGQIIAAADIAAGKFVYAPAANAVGATLASFKFEVQDSGGTAGGGTDVSATGVATLDVERKQVNGDGTYTVTYLAAPGAAYSSYTVLYSAKNAPISALYSNGETETWNRNTDGSVHDIAYAGVTGAAYTSYDVVYGPNGKPASETWYASGGTPYKTEAWNADGSYSIGVTASGTSFGAPYTSYAESFNAKGKPVSETWSNGAAETWSYDPTSGALTEIVVTGITNALYVETNTVYGANGKPATATYSNGLKAAWTFNANASYSIAYAASGSVHGVDFASYQTSFDPSGFHNLTVYYDAAHKEVARITYSSGGKPVFTLGALPAPAADAVDTDDRTAVDVEATGPVELVAIASGADQAPAAVGPGPRYDDWLGAGAAAEAVAPSDHRAAMSAVPSRADMAGAVLLGALAAPMSAAVGAVRARSRLSLYDPVADRLLPFDGDEGEDDAPFTMPPDDGAIDWHVVR